MLNTEYFVARLKMKKHICESSGGGGGVSISLPTKTILIAYTKLEKHTFMLKTFSHVLILSNFDFIDVPRYVHSPAAF